LIRRTVSRPNVNVGKKSNSLTRKKNKERDVNIRAKKKIKMPKEPSAGDQPGKRGERRKEAEPENQKTLSSGKNHLDDQKHAQRNEEERTSSRKRVSAMGISKKGARAGGGYKFSAAVKGGRRERLRFLKKKNGKGRAIATKKKNHRVEGSFRVGKEKDAIKKRPNKKKNERGCYSFVGGKRKALDAPVRGH